MSYKFNPFTGTLDIVGAGVANEEVFTFPNFASFPPTGETGKLYIDGSNGNSYYWDGASYQLTASGGTSWGSISGTLALQTDLQNELDAKQPLLPIVYLYETSTIADIQAGKIHYYIGNAQITFDYDLEPFPTPIPVSGYDLVNLSVHEVFIYSDLGNGNYILTPNQRLRNVQVYDNGNGVWAVIADEYVDNIYDLQQVTNKGSSTTNPLIVRTSPNTYRTIYTILGQEVQRTDLGYTIIYRDFGIIKLQNNTLQNFSINLPDISGNAPATAIVVNFRPNVSGTVAYLEELPNYVVVKSLSNLPTPDINGAIQLQNNKTYLFQGLVNLGTNYLVAGTSNTIMGFDKSDDGIIYTGTGAAIRSTNYTCTISNIFTSQPNGQLIDFVGREIDSIQIRECIIGSGAIGTVNGGNIVAFNNNICSANMTGGLTIEGTGRNIGIANNYFANENAPVILNLPSGTFRTAKIADNDFRVNNIGIQVGSGFMFTTQGGGQISDNIFSGTAPSSNRIVGVDDDTIMWLLENNTGLVSTSDGYSPNTIKVLTDDFFTGGTETGEIGDLAWQITNGTMASNTVAAAGRPGVIRRSSGNTVNQVASFYMGRTANSPNFAFQDWVSNIWIFRLVDDLATTIVHAGVSTDWGTLTPTHGVYFEKLGADTTWFAVSRNNGVQTRVDTTVPVVLNQYYKFEIIKRGVSLVYKIDGIERVTITTNLPDNADLLHFGNTVTSTTNAVRSIDIDYFSGIIKTNNR